MNADPHRHHLAQKFAAMQRDHTELISFLAQRDILSTVVVHDSDPSQLTIRAVGLYRGEKWHQEVHVSVFDSPRTVCNLLMENVEKAPPPKGPPK